MKQQVYFQKMTLEQIIESLEIYYILKILMK